MSNEIQKRPVIRPLNPAELIVLPNAVTVLSDEPPPIPEQSLIVVAEIDDRIVGTITAERVWCVSNFWVDRELRGNGVAAELARTIAALNTEGLREMLCTTNKHVALLAHSFGFVPVRGTLFRR